jgi:hypothetical protein
MPHRCCKEHSQRLLRTSELRDKSTSIEDDAEWCAVIEHVQMNIGA